MQLSDTAELRSLLTRFFPGLTINDVAKKSGQRVVYFCTVSGQPQVVACPLEFTGSCVAKVSQGVSPQSIAYIQREIAILGSLCSPYFPALLYNDVFFEDPDTEERFPHRLFITFEQLIHGDTLSNCRGAFVSENAVLHLLKSLVIAMTPLWGRRPSIVHRDLKPDNILIEKTGAPVIIDLGIAREAEQDGVTLSCFPWGPCTPHYASPEQARNQKHLITFKSDIFSLGVIAYELLTGENPFAPAGMSDIQQLLDRVVKIEPTLLSKKIALGKRTEALVHKMLEKAPYKRHRRPEYLLSDINEALLENEL